MSSIKIRDLQLSQARLGAELLGRAMRDNPLHLAAFGYEPDDRESALTRVFGAVLPRQIAMGSVLGAFSSGKIVGVASMLPPGKCQLSPVEKIRALPGLVLGSGVISTGRVLIWMRDWARQDPQVAHWHLGPVGVERDLQGQGIGMALMREFCGRVDHFHSVAYLETDRSENVPFYERYGFTVIEEHPVMDIPNWFMLREATAD